MFCLYYGRKKTKEGIRFEMALAARGQVLAGIHSVKAIGLPDGEDGDLPPKSVHCVSARRTRRLG